MDGTTNSKSVIVQAKESEEKVIVKVLVNKSTDEEYINNLSKEVKIIKEIKNPNLIHINNMFQYSACGKTYYYIESEYFKGISLGEKIENNKLEEKEAINMVKEICESINEFHSNNLSFNILRLENIYPSSLDKSVIIESFLLYRIAFSRFKS